MTDGSGIVEGARLRAAREAAGFSLGQMAAKVPYSKAALGHYETGLRTITPDVLSWYERICGTSYDPVATVTALGRADVDRRSFLWSAAYSAALSATALATIPEAARLIALRSTRRVGIAEVEAVHSVTAAFLQLDEARGGGVGRTAVAEFLATDVAEMLSARFASADIRMQAFSAAAELAYLGGFKAHDAGRDAIAQRYYLGALRLAEEAGTPAHDAFALRILALQGVDIRERRFSIGLAEAAVRRSKGRVGVDAQALFQVALARCHAESGNKMEAIVALREVEPVINPDVTGETPRFAAMWCNKATIVDQAAKTFTALGDHAEAARHYGLGATMWNRVTHARVHALTTADAGLAQWRMGDSGAAVQLWRPVVPTLQGIQSARTASALEKIRRHAPELIEA